MKLFIDTTTKYVSIITFDHEQIHLAKQYQGNNDHTTTIYNHLQAIDLKTIEAIYVTSGPGSYTGVRIGVLVAKTLAHELNADLFAINTLDLFFYGNNNPVLLDARGKKYFKYDGQEYTQIGYDQQTSETLIDQHVTAKWLLDQQIINKFKLVDPLDLKIEYLKEAIWLSSILI